MGDGPVEQHHPEAVPEAFYSGFVITSVFVLGLLLWYYREMDAEQFEILRMLVSSVALRGRSSQRFQPLGTNSQISCAAWM